MKKKELRRMKPLYATPKMLKRARQDVGVQKETRYIYGNSVKYTEYEYNLYYRGFIETRS